MACFNDKRTEIGIGGKIFQNKDYAEHDNSFKMWFSVVGKHGCLQQRLTLGRKYEIIYKYEEQ